MKVVIVGGVAGGASAAARLRRLDENAEIIMFEKGEYISYANCGLPYFIGGVITNKSALTLHTPESFKERFNLDVRIKEEVVNVDPIEKKVTIFRHHDHGYYDEMFDYLILSPGATPIIPNLPGIDASNILTLRTVNDAVAIADYIKRNVIKKAVVIGGGYIGVEMAENLAKQQIDVEIVEMADHVIASLDYDMAAILQNYLRSNKIQLTLTTKVEGFEKTEKGLKVLTSRKTIDADLVILSIGVRPDTDFLKDTTIARNARGLILVNQQLETNHKGIYAIGDAIEIEHFVTQSKGFIPLAGPANKQGRIVANNICGIEDSYQHTQGTSILKVFDMAIATTGISEQVAKALNYSYDKVFVHGQSHATYYPGATGMILKVLFEKPSGRILGAQIIGFDGVDKRIDVLATAIRAKMTAIDLTELELAYAPPFSSAKDPVNMVGYAIDNVLKGLVHQFHWDEVDILPRDGSVQLVDINPPFSYYKNHIDGFVNIPFAKLRSHITMLDPNKPIYLNCSTAVTSYYAYRLLTQLGFTNVQHLSGGLALYSLVKRNQIDQK